MISEKERSRIGKEAANRGIANEHIALGVQMHKYNASKVDLPSSKYDLIIEKQNNDFIRIQSKSDKNGISFIGNMRGGKSIRGGSDKRYAYRYSRSHCDIIMGVKSIINSSGILERVDLYFMPTILIEVLKTKSISYGKIKGFKNNWKILENSKNEKFIINSTNLLIKQKKLNFNSV